MMSKRKWEKFLSKERLCKEYLDPEESVRTPFQRDFDRIIFSSAFRRLQDKTQVFPLSNSDYVRTRLTHSLETASVGRSLGMMVGDKIIKKYKLEEQYTSFDFGAIVATACLAHDIGNPPFGHSGEDAIQTWFEKNIDSDIFKCFCSKEKEDFKKFEGNAQGFRILTKLQSPDNDGGMQLTYAVLATYMKYPRISSIDENEAKNFGISGKKFGIFHSELENFKKVAEATGLIQRDKDDVKIDFWQRHPLSFLVEAADDICYHIIDFEDGFRLGYIPFTTAKKCLLKCISSKNERKEKRKKIKTFQNDKEKIEYLRAHAINSFISDVVEIFIENEESICNGNFNDELTEKIENSVALKNLKYKTKEHVYKAHSVLETELAGYETLGGLLELFTKAVHDVIENDKQASKLSKKLVDYLPQQFFNKEDDIYERLLKITDYISGMTDSFAISTYRKLKGIELPY
jgi:dGTPase